MSKASHRRPKRVPARPAKMPCSTRRHVASAPSRIDALLRRARGRRHHPDGFSPQLELKSSAAGTAPTVGAGRRCRPRQDLPIYPGSERTRERHRSGLRWRAEIFSSNSPVASASDIPTRFQPLSLAPSPEPTRSFGKPRWIFEPRCKTISSAGDSPACGGFAMLFFGRQRSRTCQGITRRAFLQVGGSTVLGLSLADQLRAGAPSAGSAKSVILLWLWGGPAHLDT